MATPVLMPRLSPTMEEGVIGAWLKEEGDEIETSELLCEIETDKASMEYESPEEGIVAKILVEPGQTIPVDTVIAIIAEEGEEIDVNAFTSASPSTSSAPVEATTTETSQTDTPTQQVQSQTTDRIKASPLAKSIAKENGIDLSTVKGTGPNGRIVADDLKHVSSTEAIPAPVVKEAPKVAPVPVVSAAPGASYEDVKNSTMRNVIAKRLSESSNTAPEFFLTMEIDMSNAIEFRNSLKAQFPEKKITFNDLVIKATAIALKANPKCNAYWMGDSIRYMNDVHISVAVAIEDGLITPVIRNANQLGLSDISAQVKDLASRAKEKKLQPDEYTGGTFSVSNLGMFGIEQFTSILNPPESGIFAVGAIVEKPVVKNGEMVIGHTMKITMTCDHRVIDGATGAALLKDVKRILENPMALAL